MALPPGGVRDLSPRPGFAMLGGHHDPDGASSYLGGFAWLDLDVMGPPDPPGGSGYTEQDLERQQAELIAYWAGNDDGEGEDDEDVDRGG